MIVISGLSLLTHFNFFIGTAIFCYSRSRYHISLLAQVFNFKYKRLVYLPSLHIHVKKILLITLAPWIFFSIQAVNAETLILSHGQVTEITFNNISHFVTGMPDVIGVKVIEATPLKLVMPSFKAGKALKDAVN